MEEITYQGETYKQITRDGYYATEDGKVLSMKSGKPFPKKIYQLETGYKWHTLRINGKQHCVGMSRICYAVQKGMFLEDIPKGTVILYGARKKYYKATREALQLMNNEKWLKGKAIKDPLTRIADLMENLRLQENYYRTGDIRPLKQKVEKMKGSMIAYSLRNGLFAGRENIRYVVDEAVSIFLDKVCRRMVVSADIQRYLEGIIRKCHAKRCSLMECKLPNEQRFMPESLDEWE